MQRRHANRVATVLQLLAFIARSVPDATRDACAAYGASFVSVYVYKVAQLVGADLVRHRRHRRQRCVYMLSISLD